MHKNYVGVWTLLTVSLLAITIVSFCNPISLLGLEIKPSGIADRLTRSTTEATRPEATPLADDVHTEAPKFPAPTDTAAQNILIIGDSMLEGLNPRLAAYAKHNGHRLNSVIWYSSTSEQWGRCDTLKVYLRRFKPTFIFISLGGNELFVKDIAAKRDKWVKRLLGQIGDIPYVWIGPPNWKPDTGINDLIRDNVPQGRFFLSNGMHFDRTRDGAHPTHASAALWMDSIARWMPAHADHPIRMQLPPPGLKARPASVVVLQPQI